MRADTKERYRRALLDKGMEISAQLAAELAGKGSSEVGLAVVPALITRPGMRPDEKLRAFLDLVERKRRSLVADELGFGHCGACETPLGESELDQMPWADRCQACSSIL